MKLERARIQINDSEEAPMSLSELLAKKDAFTETLVRTAPLPVPRQGEVLVKIDKFGLTANNISYALTGDAIGYWKFFPAGEPWGKVPVWGFGDVIASNCPDVPEGERLFGFFPIASHVILHPGHVSGSSLTDAAPHRQALPQIYNQYRRTKSEPGELSAREDDRALFFPLFATSFILCDWLFDNDWFGAKQAVIVGASSKTGFGLANMISRHSGPHPRVVGLTSLKNIAFVTSLGFYDEVVSYEEIASLDASKPTAIVDMAGDGKLTAALHHHFKDNVKVSSSVGATHWTEARNGGDLPGARPAFFFAPVQFGKRASEWGMGEVMRRALSESLRAAAESRPHINMIHHKGAEAVQREFLRTVRGEVPPREGLILSF
jgi:hypothetical protein